eukprot:g35592.t1
MDLEVKRAFGKMTKRSQLCKKNCKPPFLKIYTLREEIHSSSIVGNQPGFHLFMDINLGDPLSDTEVSHQASLSPDAAEKKDGKLRLRTVLDRPISRGKSEVSLSASPICSPSW